MDRRVLLPEMFDAKFEVLQDASVSTLSESEGFRDRTNFQSLYDRGNCVQARSRIWKESVLGREAPRHSEIRVRTYECLFESSTMLPFELNVCQPWLYATGIAKDVLLVDCVVSGL